MKIRGVAAVRRSCSCCFKLSLIGFLRVFFLMSCRQSASSATNRPLRCIAFARKYCVVEGNGLVCAGALVLCGNEIIVTVKDESSTDSSGENCASPR